jgi:hypothetical protein
MLHPDDHRQLGLVPAAAQTVVGNRGGLRLLKHGLGSGFATVMGAAAVLLLNAAPTARCVVSSCLPSSSASTFFVGSFFLR